MTDAEFRAWARDVRPDTAGLPLAKLRIAALTVLERAEAAEAKLAQAELDRDGANLSRDATVEALQSAEAKLAEVEGVLATESTERIRCRDGWAAAESREKALREALRRYGMHSFSCPVSRARGPNPNCTCGFRAALAAGKETE